MTLKEQEEMGRHVVEFFTNSYKKEDTKRNNLIRRSMFNNIPIVFGDKENDKLKEKVLEEEVKNGVFSMKAFKPLGLDDSPPTFF